jgi:predicted Zn-dependent protease with MMP-like domain
VAWPVGRRGRGSLKFKDFERAAQEAYEEIPEEYKEGIDGLVVSRESQAHPDLPDIYTMGECLTEDWSTDYQGPDTTRSVVVLYWGSFKSLAGKDAGFDWDGELWETLTHELRHHLESLAREDALEGVDYALDETFKRDQDLDFDPWYFQHGDRPEAGLYQVERSYYLEQEWTAPAFDAATHVAFSWAGKGYRIPRPEEQGDVHYVWIRGVLTEPATLELVLVRKRSWWEDAKRLLGTYRPVVLESQAEAEPDPDAEQGPPDA